MSKICYCWNQKIAYVVYFVIEVSCENLFNLGSQKSFFLYLQLSRYSLHCEAVFCEMKNMQCYYFFGSFFNCGYIFFKKIETYWSLETRILFFAITLVIHNLAEK